MPGRPQVGSWRLVHTRQAQRDAKKLAASGLRPKAEILLEILARNPFEDPPPFEKLVCDLAGAWRVDVRPGGGPDGSPGQERERVRNAQERGGVLPDPIALGELAQPPAVLPAVGLVIAGLGQPDLLDLPFGRPLFLQPLHLPET